ncbi:DUF434 domain-containing protein [Hugenholtzia roseola]|uniref:DUF434 domain-containing protein n=1 Tax=Hugenholtzia roseola TaxID=1002 RepID=UPI0003FC9BE9|nr:DUF434 domain-containing protein [Hugenholtzia roseola]
MPHHQKHRGANPKDAENFAPALLPLLRQALSDLQWLLDKNYSFDASLKLVGDKFTLTTRQRKALQHCLCTQAQAKKRQEKEVGNWQQKWQNPASKPPALLIDGYNLLITLECALSGAPIFVGLDGCLRDIASIHSTYRKVEETLPALQLLAEAFSALAPPSLTWILDAPISNSGRLKGLILETFALHAPTLPCEVFLEKNADKSLIERSWQGQIPVISADSWVIEEAFAWVNFLPFLLEFMNGILLSLRCFTLLFF